MLPVRGLLGTVTFFEFLFFSFLVFFINPHKRKVVITENYRRVRGTNGEEPDKEDAIEKRLEEGQEEWILYLINFYQDVMSVNQNVIWQRTVHMQAKNSDETVYMTLMTKLLNQISTQEVLVMEVLNAAIVDSACTKTIYGNE